MTRKQTTTPAGQALRTAAQYARKARDQRKNLRESHKSQATAHAKALGEAMRRAAETFREDHDDQIAGYADALAEETLRLGRYLDREDGGGMMHGLRQHARRHPALLLAGMVVMGVALMRFLTPGRA